MGVFHGLRNHRPIGGAYLGDDPGRSRVDDGKSSRRTNPLAVEIEGMSVHYFSAVFQTIRKLLMVFGQI